MRHVEVNGLAQAWLDQGRLNPEDWARLADLLAGLRELYRQHIGFEDREVCPAAERVLPDAERRAVGAEMPARRGLMAARGGPDVG